MRREDGGGCRDAARETAAEREPAGADHGRAVVSAGSGERQRARAGFCQPAVAGGPALQWLRDGDVEAVRVHARSAGFDLSRSQPLHERRTARGGLERAAVEVERAERVRPGVLRDLVHVQGTAVEVVFAAPRCGVGRGRARHVQPARHSDSAAVLRDAARGVAARGGSTGQFQSAIHGESPAAADRHRAVDVVARDLIGNRRRAAHGQNSAAEIEIASAVAGVAVVQSERRRVDRAVGLVEHAIASAVVAVADEDRSKTARSTAVVVHDPDRASAQGQRRPGRGRH